MKILPIFFKGRETSTYRSSRSFKDWAKKAFISLLILLFFIFGTFFAPWIKKTEAVWFDSNWSYRTAIPITTHAGSETGVYVSFTIDTATPISAGKMQSDCGDLRFATYAGKLLPYYIVSSPGCNNSATVIHVYFDSFPSGSQTIYYYYGNPVARNGFSSSDFPTPTPYQGDVTYQVNASGNDGDQNTNGLSGSIVRTSVRVGNDANAKIAGTRFVGVGIQQGSVIASATFTLTGAVTYTGCGCTIQANIYGENVDNSAIFTATNNNISSRSKTTASVSTGSLANITQDTQYPFTVTTLVQEVVNRGSWSSGNALSLLIQDNGSTSSQWQDFYSYDGSTSKAATLRVQWNTPNLVIGSVGSEEKGPSPLAYWAFDEGSGTVANDSTVNKHTATLAASTATPTWAGRNECISGSCLKFDGVNDYASSSAAIDLTGTSAVTVEFWMNWQAYSNNDEMAMEFSQDTNNTTSGFFVDPNYSSGSFVVSVKGDVGTNDAEFTRPKAGWHHYAFVLDKSQSAASEVVPYVDGVAVSYAKGFSSNNTNTFGTHILNFMSRGGASLFGAGLLDEVKVYPFTRSAAQIKADYNAKLNGNSSNVLGVNANSAGPGGLSQGITHYYKFDEASWTNNCSTKSVKDSAGAADLISCPNTTGPTTLAGGKYGNVGTFDGTDDQIDASFQESYGKRWTVAEWFKTSDTQGYLFDTRDNDTDVQANGVAVFTDGANTYTFYQIINNVTTKYYTYTSATLDGNWHHLVVTRDGDNSISFYIDKTKLSVASITTDVDISSSSETWGGIHYGNRNNGNVYALNGSIDEARIYSRSFSQNDVNNLYEFAPGPIVYWNMEEGGGNTIKDSSGNNNNSSTFTGTVSFTQGKIGKAVNIGALNSNIRIPETTLTHIGSATDSYTVAAWFKTTRPAPDGSHPADIITKLGNSGVSSPFTLYLGTGGELTFENTGCPSHDDQAISSNPVNSADGKWHYAAGVKDLSSGKDYLYLDGVLIASHNITVTETLTTGICNDTDDITIGNGGSGYTQYDYTGSVDDVKIYNYARSAKQVIQDMNGSHPAGGSPVGSQVAYWDFDEGYGTTVHDNVTQDGAQDLTMSASTNWTASGKFGKAFDGGDNKRASITDNDNLDFTAAEDMSISFWFKSDATTNPSSREYLVDKLPSGATAGGYAVYSSSSSDGLICFGIDDDNTSFPEDSVCSSGDLYDTNWHHLVAKKTGSSRLDLYVDGKSTGTPDTSISASVNTLANTSTFYVGDDNATNGTDEYLGNIDELKIYRSALTDDEIRIDYNKNASQVLGSSGTSSSGAADNSADRMYCPPGDTTATCGPVGEWKFEEGQGSTVNDSTGTGNNLSWEGTGIQWVRGKVGKAGNFNGSNNDVTINPGTSLNTTTPTVEAWFKSTTTSSGGIVGKGARWYNLYFGAINAGNGTGGAGCNGTDVAGTVGFMVQNSGTGNGCASSASTIFNDGKWHFAVGTYNGSIVKLYVDGKLITSTSVSLTVGGANNAFFIGQSSASDYFNGQIDNVRVFNYARSAAQIAWDYNQGKPVGYWDMDECQGSTVYDSSGNGNHGTINLGSGTQTSVGDCNNSGSTMRYTGRVGKINSGLNFDKDDDLVDAGSGSSLDDLSQKTVCAWIKPNSIGELNGGFNYGEIVTKLNVGAGGIGWALELSNQDSSIASVYYYHTFSGVDGYWHGPNNAITLSSWNHICVSYDDSSTSNTPVIYVNGKSVAVTTVPGQTPTGTVQTDASYNLGIGSFADDTSQVFDGIIDDVRIYNYMLTAAQIKQVYNGGAAVRFGPSTGTP